MRTLALRQRLARVVVATTAVALVAACNASKGNGSIGETTDISEGMVLVSDGTNVVRIGEQKVTFGTTVTDASFSPDGSRIAFVNADGNIATARPDGKGVKVLTDRLAGAVRSRPTWVGVTVVFAEKKGGSPAALMSVPANGAGTVAGPAAEGAAYVGFLPDGGDMRPQENKGSAPSGLGFGGQGKDVAWQREGSKGPEVWVVDVNQREPEQVKVADGSEPALAPDGHHVAYVDTSGQIQVVDTQISAQAQTPTRVQVTFGATAPNHLTWSSDAKMLAYATAAGVESVSAVVPAGATSNPATKLTSTPGVPTFVPARRDQVNRVAGNDPVQVSVAASQANWPTQEHRPENYNPYNRAYASAVYLTGTTDLPTVLAGAQMVDDGPILFTSGSTLDSRTAAEIKRIFGPPLPAGQDPSPPVVYIIGGTNIVPAQAESAVKALGYKTSRTTAADPVSMAVTASGSPAQANQVIVVDVADTSLYVAAISSLGVNSRQTVLLSSGGTLPDKVRTFLGGLNPQFANVYGLGPAAQGALAAWTGRPAALKVTPIGGADPAATIAALLNRFGQHTGAATVVDASNLTDVITAIGLSRKYGATIFAIDPKAGVNASLLSWLDTSSATIDVVYIVDSKGVIGGDVEKALGAAVGGPLGAASNTNPKAAV